MPITVRLASGARPGGEIMHQVNKTKAGYLIALFNQQGIDKTPNGIAQVDRRAFVDVLVQTRLPIRTAHEYTQNRAIAIERNGKQALLRLRVPAGDLQVVTVAP
jgi:hypothetical protein